MKTEKIGITFDLLRVNICLIQMERSQTFQVLNDYGHSIIKEEIIIPEIKEEPCEVDADDSFAFPTNIPTQNVPEVSKLKPVIKSEGKRRNDKTVTQPPQKSKHLCIGNVSVNKNNSVTRKIDTALKNLSKARCSKCSNTMEVRERKARCSKCMTPLIYLCESCCTSYKTYTDLRYHIKNKHSTTNWTKINCDECGQSFAYSKGLTSHLRSVHGIFDSVEHKKSLTCKKCGKLFAYPAALKIHRRDCGRGAIYKCNDCSSFTTNYKSRLVVHTREKHLNYDERCQKCKKVFTNRKSMKRHWKIYCGKGKRLTCHHCARKLYRKDEMVAHIKTKHPQVYV